MVCIIDGKRVYLCRAVDREGEVLDVVVAQLRPRLCAVPVRTAAVPAPVETLKVFPFSPHPGAVITRQQTAVDNPNSDGFDNLRRNHGSSERHHHGPLNADAIGRHQLPGGPRFEGD